MAGGGLANARLVLRSVAVLIKRNRSKFCIILALPQAKSRHFLPDEKGLIDNAEPSSMGYHNEASERGVDYLREGCLKRIS